MKKQRIELEEITEEIEFEEQPKKKKKHKSLKQVLGTCITIVVLALGLGIVGFCGYKIYESLQPEEKGFITVEENNLGTIEYVIEEKVCTITYTTNADTELEAIQILIYQDGKYYDSYSFFSEGANIIKTYSFDYSTESDYTIKIQKL